MSALSGNSFSQVGFFQNWAYPTTPSTRDLRLDFMRGVAMLLLFVSHFNYFSAFMYIGWERFGIVSSAEIFIALAGIVVGILYRKKLQTEGLHACTRSLFGRGFELYRIMVIMIIVIGLLQYVSFINTAAVTTFTDQFTKTVYPMYPDKEDGFFNMILQSFLLRAGPHQFQIIGLYVVLFMLTPVVLWMLNKKRTLILLGLSWGLYLFNFFTPESEIATAEIKLTGAQFEFGFPSIVWQLIYIHSLVAGFYWTQLKSFMVTTTGKIIIGLSIFLTIGFIFLTFNNPIDEFPDWAKLSYIAPDDFKVMYQSYFLKYKLGPGRLINAVVLFITCYALLTRIWVPFNRSLGWLFIPLGEASLYVFFVHVFILLLISNTPFPAYNNFWVNTGIHACVLLLAWVMVKTKFLYKWIPN